MSKGTNKIFMCFPDDWGEQLLGVLNAQQDELNNIIATSDNKETVRVALLELKRNQKLIDKISNHSNFEKNANGTVEVQLYFTPFEIKQLVWQLLQHSATHTIYTDNNLLKELEANHSEIKNGDINLKTMLTKDDAFYLFTQCRFGHELLIRNKNGKLYFVDHGFTKLIKKDNRWEDLQFGFDDNIFIECEIPIEICSWSDKEPLNIFDYLKENGWLEKI